MANDETREIKNTAPAVMTDAGPRGTTRKKSKDGRYTASEQEVEYTDGRQVQHHERTRSNANNEKIMNDNVYEPLFVRTMEQTLVRDLLKIKNPDQEPYLIKSNSWNDEKLGIDFQLGLRSHDENGVAIFDDNNMYDIDLKVMDTFGKENDYKAPRVSLNLWKCYPGKSWEEGSYLNRKHANNFFYYVMPKSDLRKKEIANNIKRQEGYNPLQDISEAKTILVSKFNLKSYVSSRLLSNSNIQDVITMFKMSDIQNLRKPEHNPLFNYMKEEKETTSFTFDIPVPGETFKARLALRTDMNEKGEVYREIRLLLPDVAFGKNGIHAKKSLIRFNNNPLLK